jgi:hypothetical protein
MRACVRGTLNPSVAGACLLAALLVAACGSGTSNSSAPTSSTTAPQAPAEHALDIAAKINAAGAGCADAANDAGPPTDAAETASCTIGDDDVAITLFADHDALVRSLPFVRHGACFVAKTKPDENLSYVEGVNWIVAPQLAANTNKVATATGGSVVKINCNA